MYDPIRGYWEVTCLALERPPLLPSRACLSLYLASHHILSSWKPSRLPLQARPVLLELVQDRRKVRRGYYRRERVLVHPSGTESTPFLCGDANDECRIGEKQKREVEERDYIAANTSAAGTQYQTPSAEDLGPDHKEPSGLPWGSLNFQDVIKRGQARAQQQSQASPGASSGAGGTASACGSAGTQATHQTQGGHGNPG